MKIYRRFTYIHDFKESAALILLLICVASSNCGFALTPRITVKIPPQTQTEIFRLNLLLGEVGSCMASI